MFEPSRCEGPVWAFWVSCYDVMKAKEEGSTGTRVLHGMYDMALDIDIPRQTRTNEYLVDFRFLSYPLHFPLPLPPPYNVTLTALSSQPLPSSRSAEAKPPRQHGCRHEGIRHVSHAPPLPPRELWRGEQHASCSPSFYFPMGEVQTGEQESVVSIDQGRFTWASFYLSPLRLKQYPYIKRHSGLRRCHTYLHS